MKIIEAIKRATNDKYGNKDLSTMTFLSSIGTGILATANATRKSRLLGIATITGAVFTTASAAADIIVRTSNYLEDNKKNEEPKTFAEEVVDSVKEVTSVAKDVKEEENISESAAKVINELEKEIDEAKKEVSKQATEAKKAVRKATKEAKKTVEKVAKEVTEESKAPEKDADKEVKARKPRAKKTPVAKENNNDEKKPANKPNRSKKK